MAEVILCPLLYVIMALNETDNFYLRLYLAMFSY